MKMNTKQGDITLMIKIPKKIQKVINAYDILTIKKTQYTNLAKVANQPIPKHKIRSIIEDEALAFKAYFLAQQNLKELYDKLTRSEVDKLIEIRREQNS